MKKVVLELPPEQGHALAQFVKRTGFDDCQRAIAMTAVLKPRRCGRRSRNCNLPSKTAASTRDDDEKADPHPGAGFSSRSDTPHTVTCTRISATQHTAVRCPSRRG
jgi:hypothetical protein